jgi:hypothetical protein
MDAVRLALLLVLPMLAGCAGGQEVTARSIRDARRLWDRAGIRDYDLEWTSTGLRNSHYRVSVRNARVESIESVYQGKAYPVRPARPEYYGIDGLFMTIEDELAQLQTATPFGQARGTKAVLRFTPDPKLGYPRSYRRDVMGTPQVLALDVTRFAPRPRPAGGS